MFNTILVLVSSKFTVLAAYAGDQACSKGFLGLIPWWHYLPPGDFSGNAANTDGCNIRGFHFISAGGQNDIPLVLLAVLDDLLRIAGIVALAFVIVGAFKYVTSQGNAEQTARAQSTVIDALLGLAIAVTATVFVDFLGNKLGGG